jgi:hypothetical protein
MDGLVGLLVMTFLLFVVVGIVGYVLFGNST